MPTDAGSGRCVTAMQRSIDLSLSTLASLVAVGLSWPYWRSHSYFAESVAAWAVYFALGFVLSIFVFYVFFRALRTLFTHEIPGVPKHAHDHGDHHAGAHHHHAEHAHHESHATAEAGTVGGGTSATAGSEG